MLWEIYSLYVCLDVVMAFNELGTEGSVSSTSVTRPFLKSRVRVALLETRNALLTQKFLALLTA